MTGRCALVLIGLLALAGLAHADDKPEAPVDRPPGKSRPLYDKKGRLTSEVFPDNVRGVFELRYTYDDHDRIRKVTELDARKRTLRELWRDETGKLERERRVEHGKFGVLREVFLDGAGVVQEERRYEYEETSGTPKREAIYGATGQLKWEVLVECDDVGRRVRNLKRDALGKVLEDQLLAYDSDAPDAKPCREVLRDAAGRTTSSRVLEYDGHYNLEKVTELDGEGKPVKQITFDSEGNKVERDLRAEKREPGKRP